MREKMYFVLDIIVNLCIIFALALFIRTFLVSPFHVFGPSMCNSLNYIDNRCIDDYGEYMIVNEAVYQSFLGFNFGEPARGDIVIFKPPGHEDQYYVKRVVGLPGDKIKIEDGYVSIWSNGEFELLDESSYLSDANLGRTLVNNNYAVYDVPEGKYFLLGDNRNRSTDSRNCFGSISFGKCTSISDNAFVSLKSVRGKAWIVFWPFENFRIL